MFDNDDDEDGLVDMIIHVQMPINIMTTKRFFFWLEPQSITTMTRRAQEHD